jgi:hypothetical protein
MRRCGHHVVGPTTDLPDHLSVVLGNWGQAHQPIVSNLDGEIDGYVICSPPISILAPDKNPNWEYHIVKKPSFFVDLIRDGI